MIGADELRDAFDGMGNVPSTDTLVDLVREAWVREQYARAEAYCLLDEDLEELHDTIYTARCLRFMCHTLHEQLAETMNRDDRAATEHIFTQLKFHCLWKRTIEGRIDDMLDLEEVEE